MNRLLCSLLFFSVTCAHAQSSTIPPSSTPELDAAIRSYYQFPGVQPTLYNGPQHYGYPPSIEGTAYFPNGDWQIGTVQYDNLTYENVTIMYDAFSDNVIVRHIYGISFTPFRDKIDRFSIGNHVFVRINKTDENNLETGFYEQVLTGPIDLLIRRKKTIKNEIVDGSVDNEFIEKYAYYLRKGNTYKRITGTQTLLDAAAEKRKEINEFIRNQPARFKKEPERVITETIRYYNQLSQ